MSLKFKIAIILLAVVASYAAVDYAIQRWGVYPSFVALEREGAVKDMDRGVEAINRELHHLDKFCGDWAPWDDTYKFAQGGNKEYEKANLALETFKNDRLNLFCVYNAKGDIVWGKVLADLDSEEPKELPLEGIVW